MTTINSWMVVKLHEVGRSQLWSFRKAVCSQQANTAHCNVSKFFESINATGPRYFAFPCPLLTSPARGIPLICSCRRVSTLLWSHQCSIQPPGFQKKKTKSSNLQKNYKQKLKTSTVLILIYFSKWNTYIKFATESIDRNSAVWCYWPSSVVLRLNVLLSFRMVSQTLWRICIPQKNLTFVVPNYMLVLTLWYLTTC